MAKGAGFEDSLLKLILTATNYANLADNTATSPNTNLYLSLHTAAPASDSQSSNETTYTGYARVAVARTTGGFTVTTNSAVLAAQATFGACTAGTATITNFALGMLSSGAGLILWTGTVSPNISVAVPVQPILSTGTTITET